MADVANAEQVDRAMTADLTIMRDRLRKETAALLGMDIDNLTAAQSVRLDRAATLRLELDDIESRKLQGATFNAVQYIAISEALERLISGRADATTDAPNSQTLIELERAIQGIIDVRQLKDAERETETMMRDEMAAIAAANNECASGGALCGDPPASAAPAGAPETDVQKMNRVNATPALPPDNRNEPWRSHVSSDGIVAPWWSGGRG
jgi:hypothetical protein